MRISLLLALVAALLLPAAAQARLPTIGVQDDRALLSPHECESMLQVAQEGLRARVVRLNVDPFAGSVPRKNHPRTMQSYDAAIRCALEHKDSWGVDRPFDVMVTVGGFAAGRGAKLFSSDKSYAARFYRKVSLLRLRWPKVKYWSFVNEPNISVSYVSPCLYAQVYRNARRALLQTYVPDPEAVNRPKVLFGELAAVRTAQYLERVARCPGKPLITDGISVHAFQFKVAPTKRPAWSRSGSLANLPRLHAVIRQHRKRLHTPTGRVPQLFVTEFGYVTPGSYRTQWVISERQAAKWWPQVIKVIKRPSWHIAMFMPYMVTAQPQLGAWSTSLMRRDGSARPALHALSRALHGELPVWVR
jgi:hypothetical protein